jgi:hypothetical protein
MSQLIDKMLEHPRRLAFVGFNAAMVLATAQFGALVASGMSGGVAGFAQVAIGYTGIALALLALLVGWMGWSGFVIYRHRGELRLGRRVPVTVTVRGSRSRHR